MSTHLGSRQAEVAAAASYLRTTTAVRERARQLLSRARHGESGWFIVDEGFLDTAASEIVNATRRRYPRGHVPVHSRWRHFEAGGVDRRRDLERLLSQLPDNMHIHANVDLTMVSVLLDANAGPNWKYTEPSTGKQFSRSEGIAIASFHAFMAGLFSSDKERPLQVDSVGLRAITDEQLAEALQVTPANPMHGFEERAVLLRRMGEIMEEEPEVFGDDVQRPSGIFDAIVTPYGVEVPHTADVAAHDILSQILIAFAPIWPASNSVGHIQLGDCWRHAAVRGEGLSDGWVPFHKLSQWMTYSLLEPFEWAGVKIRNIDALTALPDWRNGGLMMDSGLLRLRDESAAREIWQPGDEIVVEWRALTLALMDEVAEAVRGKMHKDEAHLPLSCILEGGSWAAGREYAQRLRDGMPPLQVASDATLF